MPLVIPIFFFVILTLEFPLKFVRFSEVILGHLFYVCQNSHCRFLLYFFSFCSESEKIFKDLSFKYFNTVYVVLGSSSASSLKMKKR